MISSLYSRFRQVSRPRPNARHTAQKCRLGLEALDGRALLSGVTPLHIVTSRTVNLSALDAVAEIASNDVWAVGGVTTAGTTKVQPLAEDFNGHTWSVVPTRTAPNGSVFNGVAGVG